MVPAWTLFLLTAVFLIREVIMRSREKSPDYDNGYHEAIIDIILEFNRLIQHTKPFNPFIIINDFLGFLNKKLHESDIP